MAKSYEFWELTTKWHPKSETVTQTNVIFMVIFYFSVFDLKWLITHDFIKQNSPHDKINLISISFILPAHTVLNNTISTQILQDTSFKYCLIHSIISDST